MRTKKVLSILLALTIVLSVVPVTKIAAADDNVMTVLGTTNNSLGTSGVKGLDMELQIKTPTVQGIQTIFFTYDPAQIKLVSKKTGKDITIPDSMAALQGGFGDTPWEGVSASSSTVRGGKMADGRVLIYVEVVYLNSIPDVFADGMTYFNFAMGFVGSTSATTMDSSTIAIATPEEAKAALGSYVCNIANDKISYVYGWPSDSGNSDNLPKPKIMVDGNELPGAVVKLTGIDAKLDKDTLAVPTKDKTATATASVAPIPEGATVPTDIEYTIPTTTGVEINKTSGVITVSPTASAGTVTVTATSKGDATKTDTVVLTLTKATPVLDSITLSSTSGTATLKAAGGADDIAVTISGVDQFGGAFSVTGKAVTVAAQTGSDATGITYADGKLKIGTDAKAGTKKLVITVDSKTANYTLTINKANGPAAPSITTEDAQTKGGKGKLKGTTTDMEYNTNATATTGWTTCDATETEVSAGTYYVRVKETATTKAGSVTSALVVGQPGTSVQPTVTVSGGGEMAEGGSKTLTATVTNADSCTGTLTYKWYKDDVEISGQKDNTLIVTEAGTYKVEVTHTNGANDPAKGTAEAEVTVKTLTAVEVTPKATVTVNKTSGIKISDLATITPANNNYAKTLADAKTTVIFYEQYEKTPADAETSTPAVMGWREATSLVNDGKYYATYRIEVGEDADHDLKIAAAAAKTQPEDEKTVDEVKELGFIEVTVKKSTSSGGGGSSTTKYTVTYDAGEHGKLDGASSERVESGKNPTKVPSVVADKGYKFVGWTLNGKSVKPASTKITAATKFVAEYEAADKTTYIQGMDKNHFQPAGNATRGQLATMLARLSKDYDASKTYTGKAPDVENGKWYTNTVNFAINKGIMNGFEDGMFRPTENIRRGEFAAMLARYLGLNTSSKGHFADVTDHWAAGYINALADAGIVNGFEDGTFKANNLLTRAEAVKMINLAVEMKYDEKADYDNSFVDVAKGAWYYEFVMPAANLDVTDYQR